MGESQMKTHKNNQIPPPLIKPRQVTGRLFVLAALLFLALTLNAAPVAHAATITVCASGCDHTTITAAITAASAGDTITVQAGTYTEADITVNKNLTITGAAASTTIVQAHASQGSVTDRVFSISSGVTATLENLTIRHGRDSFGGGILLEGTLTLNNSVVQHNSSFSQGGGGILIQPAGFLTINNSTISNNTSTNVGGGGFIALGTVTVNNSTISGNTAAKHGGGFVVSGSGASLTLNNSTVTGNTADSGNAGSFSGGGIKQLSSASVTIKNTIIIGNLDNSGTGEEDCSDTITSQGYNLVGSGTGCPSSGTGDLTTSNPANELSATLADNGGPTPTHALLPGSAAIDAGDTATSRTILATGCLASDGSTIARDQRNAPRAQGASNGGDDCDIGAYEDDSTPLAVTLASFQALATSEQVVVTWQTVSEVHNLGFNLYRANSLDGAQEQLNGSLISAQAPGSGQGAAYEWQDEEVTAGTTYYYWLADVDVNGVETRHGPLSATANTPTAIRLDSFQNTTTLPLWALLSLCLVLLVGGWRMLRPLA